MRPSPPLGRRSRAAPRSVNAMRELVSSGRMDFVLGQVTALKGDDKKLTFQYTTSSTSLQRKLGVS